MIVEIGVKHHNPNHNCESGSNKTLLSLNGFLIYFFALLLINIDIVDKFREIIVMIYFVTKFHHAVVFIFCIYAEIQNHHNRLFHNYIVYIVLFNSFFLDICCVLLMIYHN